MESQAPYSPSSPPCPAASPGSSGHEALPAAFQQTQQTQQTQTQPSPQSSFESTSPPADVERHPKGKRNRTKAEDKAILEEAYLKNSKPDKAARLELLSRVSMPNEKAVQIWFQNRRQNDRRKSRPWSPQAVEAVTQGRFRIVSADALPFNTPIELGSAPVAVQSMSQPEHAASPSVHSDAAGYHSEIEPEKSRDVVNPEATPAWQGTGHAVAEETAVPALVERAGEARPVLSRSFSGPTGYLSNRRNTAGFSGSPPSLGHDDSFRSGHFPSTCPSSFPSDVPADAFIPRPRSPPSRYRLSMSLEGRAEIIQAVPSPPRPSLPPPAPDVLQRLSLPRLPEPFRRRSSSICLQTFSDVAKGLPPRLTLGRAHSVHSWEYIAASENREDALTVQAKLENTGSATAAINLLRSTSSTSSGSLEQSSRSAKRGAPAGNTGSRQVGTKRPKLSRSFSSLARMERTMAPSQRHNIQSRVVGPPSDKLKTTRTLISVSGNDSDKENWSPDEDGNARPFRRASSSSTLTSTGRRLLPSGPPSSKHEKSRNPRRTLGQEPRRTPLLSSRAQTTPASSLAHYHYPRSRAARQSESTLEIYEDAENDSSNLGSDDGEVQRFMGGGGGGGVSPIKEKDVDAAAGLLSLSRGNWGQ